MPIYEYLCDGCGKRFEALTFGQTQPECPKCQSTQHQRLLSTFAVGAGGQTRAAKAMPEAGGCGSCGDPRGPGACAMN